MSQLYCTGRVVSELELKASVKGIPYVCFPVAERVGYGKTAHTQYLSVWAWGAMARQLADSVGRGSVLWVSGSLAEGLGLRTHPAAPGKARPRPKHPGPRHH